MFATFQGRDRLGGVMFDRRRNHDNIQRYIDEIIEIGKHTLIRQ